MACSVGVDFQKGLHNVFNVGIYIYIVRSDAQTAQTIQYINYNLYNYITMYIYILMYKNI